MEGSEIVKFASSSFAKLSGLQQMNNIHGSLFEKYFNYDNILSKPSIKAYDHWLSVTLPKYLKEKFVFTDGSYMYFENIQFHEYQKTPRYHREQNTSYTIRLEATLVYYKPDLDVSTSVDKVHITDIPLMLGSKKCIIGRAKTDEEIYALGEDPLDPFGYFIINGTERVIINQEKLRTDKYICIVKPISGNSESKKMKDVSPEKMFVIDGNLTYTTHYGTNIFRITKSANSEGAINLFLSFFGKNSKSTNAKDSLVIPVLLIFKYFGDLSVDDVMDMIIKFSPLKYRDLIKVFLSRARIDYIVNGDLYTYIHKYSSIKDFEVWKHEFRYNMKYKFLPNCPSENSKMEMIAWMICKYCIAHIDPKTIDDRDAWMNKKLECPGRSLENLFRALFKNIYMAINNEIYLKNNITLNSIQSVINKENMSATFSKSLAGPKWGKSTNATDRMTEVLESKSILNMMSQLSKINVNTSAKNKAISIRTVYGDQWGFVCPSETSEGELCGIVKHHACTAKMSLERDPELIYSKVTKYLSGVKTDNHKSPFFINGYIYGWCDGLSLREILIEMKRSGEIWYDTSIVLEGYDFLLKRIDYSYCPLFVYCDADRLIRPVLVYDYNPKTKNGSIRNSESMTKTFVDMLESGTVEFIDTWETNYIKIAQNVTDLENRKNMYIQQLQRLSDFVKSGVSDSVKLLELTKQTEHAENVIKFTHVELDPNALLSYATALVPMAERIAGPRVGYQAGMNKQALETEKGLGRDHKYTSAAGTSPNFITNMNKILRTDMLAGGRNLYVAIMMFKGFNQEDGIIMNRDIVDRLYFSFHKNVIKEVEINTDKDEMEYVGIPKNLENTLSKNPYYRHLSKTTYEGGIPSGGGIVQIGSMIHADDILVAKFTASGKNNSVRASIDDEGRVIDVKIKEIIGKNTVICTIKIKKFNNPQEGDKFAIRYSQKGVIAKVVPGYEMPLMENGKPVDMIINPYAVLSRMTVTLAIEMLTGNYSALVGERFDATSFSDFNVEDFMNRLRSLGIYFGYQNLINPDTGRYFEEKINVGRAYYMALPHIVSSKIQARSTGPVDQRTRLVIGGRNRGGGVRAGEMEIDTFISHGALNVTLDRIMYTSDRHDKAVCKKCGQDAWFNKEEAKFECKLKCGTEHLGRITIPYSFNRFMDIIRLGSIHGLVNYVNRKDVEDANETVVSTETFVAPDEEVEDEETEEVEETEEDYVNEEF